MAFSAQMEAFRVSSRAIGIDLIRSQIGRNLGTYVANATTTFRAGMLVQLNAAQEIVVSDGVTPFGFAKYTKANTLFATVVGEQVVLSGVGAHNLRHAGLFTAAGAVLGVKVAHLTTGVAYTEGAGNDYTCNYVNGQITRLPAPGGTIADGETVAVTYAYQVTEAELKFEGRNFWNFINDVDIQGGKITVINEPGIIFTTQYDPSEVYAVNDNLYAGVTAQLLDGLVTIDNTGALIGNVFQVPTAADPFMGIRYNGGMVA